MTEIGEDRRRSLIYVEITEKPGEKMVLGQACGDRIMIYGSRLGTEVLGIVLADR